MTAAKSIALRDLYGRTGERFGMIQSMGVDADYGNIVHHLGQLYDRSILRRARRLRHLIRIPAAIAARMFGNAAIFVGYVEDYAQFDNRVVLNRDRPDTPALVYRIPPDLRARRDRLRREIRRTFRGHRLFFLGHTPQPNWGHPTGTLRFGTDPASSVLTPECRAHDLDNLYVADASFMPSSLGVNPSLMISANALRVADIIARRMRPMIR